MARKNKPGNKQKAKNTTNTGKNSGEKTKIATSTNDTETIVDKKEKQNENQNLGDNQIDESENHTSDKVEIATEEQQETKESDKGDCSEMRTPTKQDDKHGSSHKKSKKKKRNSPKKQETSTGKSEAFEPNTSTSSNRQDSAETHKKSKDTEDKHKDDKRDRNQSERRQDHNSSKDSVSHTKQEDTAVLPWYENPDFQENHENSKRDRSKSGSRQDHSGSSKDFPAKEEHGRDGSSSRDRKSSSHQKYQGSEQDRNRQPYDGQTNSGKNYKEDKKQGNRQEGREFNQNRDKNSRAERSRSGNRQDPNHSSRKNDYPHSPSRHSQSKSQDHRKSSNDLKPNKQDDVDVGKLFEEYWKEYDKVKGVYKYVRIKETFGDLFECSEEYSLGHCVAEDMGMGAGIAVTFRQKFKQVDELLDQRQRQGGLAVLKDNNRFIYYLVTKQKSNGKPTYQTLFKSLVKMRQHIIENNVKKLALPTIGCGLDRLEWDNVKYMLEFLFRDLDMEILIYHYRQDDESTTTQQSRIRNCKVVHESYTIDKIESGTLIIYLSSEDGEITQEMLNLDKKFNFLHRFKTSPKRLGDTIPFNANDYYLYGCIVKKTKQDLISFKELFKCVSKINRENRKLKFNFVGFQAIDDRNDEFVNDKIINILRNSLSYVDVYICYPKNLYYLMPPPRESFSGNY